MRCLKLRWSLPVLLMLGCIAPAWGQGPLVLMGIDAEDGGPGAHGPISVYESVLTNGSLTGILDNVTNGGSGILVIGGSTGATATVTKTHELLLR
ncbi:MAG: hypothetical protein IH889_04970 [Planctomycetes bacterium]|nr:hypothetical protein [Planctomycetota bacterium]